jgi:hypothetical protein
MGRTPFENSDGEQFNSNEDLEKYWSRTVRVFLFLSSTSLLISTTFFLFPASRQVGRQVGVLERDGEAAPADDCAQCGSALHGYAGDR